MELTLRSGQIVRFDDADAALVLSYRWHAHPAGKTVYARGYTGKRRAAPLVYMHRLLMAPKATQEVDHRSGDGLDNRRGNLRLCTRGQNNANRHILQTKTSNHKGVHFEQWSSRWRAEVNHEGKRYTLGRFDSEESAAAAYREAATRLFGEFANPATRLL